MSQVNAIGLLPLWHVSGFTAWMRSVLTGGTYLPWEWKDIEAGSYPAPAPEGACLSLVPTQLQRLLETAEAIQWMKRFSLIFVGGGPSWEELSQRAAAEGLPISLSYGMTETLAMVAALQPSDFLAGNRTSGRAMPHAAIDLTSDERIRIQGGSVHRGYYPEFSESRTLTTEDIGHFDDFGNLKVLGRRDAIIITGGKKVDPLVVEALLRKTGAFTDLAIIGMADPKWGQAVTLCYPAAQDAPDEALVGEAIARLAAHERPKHIHAISPWPRNAQGKVNRAELMAAIKAEMAESK